MLAVTRLARVNNPHQARQLPAPWEFSMERLSRANMAVLTGAYNSSNMTEH